MTTETKSVAELASEIKSDFDTRFNELQGIAREAVEKAAAGEPLTKAAKDRKLSLGQVETMEQQMAMLGALEEKEQVRLLEKTLEESAKGKEILDRMMGA